MSQPESQVLAVFNYRMSKLLNIKVDIFLKNCILQKYSQQQLDGSIGDVLLLTMSALTQQGCYIEPTRPPGLFQRIT